MKLPQFLALSAFLTWTEAATAEPKPIFMNTETANVATLTFTHSLLRGANIYLCALGERKQTGPQSGLVSLKITKVLRGAPRDSMTLPYTIREADAFILGGSIWPSLKALDEKLLLCVVVPNAVDRAAGNFKDITEAASSVIVVNSVDDAEVKKMATIGEIADSTEVKQLTRILERGRKDSRTEVRRFALKWGAFALNSSPEISLEIIREQAASAKSKAEIDDTVELATFVGGLFYRIPPIEESGKYVYRCLVTLAQSESYDVRIAALSKLAGCISQLKVAGRKSSLADALSKEERAGLAALVKAEKGKLNIETKDKLDLIESALAEQK